MIYVVLYHEDDLVEYVATSEDRDVALNLLAQQRMTHPDRAYSMEKCSLDLFMALIGYGWQESQDALLTRLSSIPPR
jgi:hypothetical protein